MPPTIGALHIDVRPRATSSEWALTLRLERPDLTGLFTHLVEDLASSTLRSPADPGHTIVNRLARWQRMLARGPSPLLDDLELRGLIAELSFLLDEALPRVGHEAAIAAWIGPFDAPKDFGFADRQVEVKATTRQVRAVCVSSLEQLTEAGVPLFLWTRIVDLDLGHLDGTSSAASWVGRARANFATHEPAAQRLEEALRAVGWEDRDEYLHRVVRLGPSACFRVHGQFPRIQRPQVSLAVLDATYRIDAGAMEPFSVSGWSGQ